MKTITLLITILFMTLPLSAIDKGSWEIYTSYNDITEIEPAGNQVFVNIYLKTHKGKRSINSPRERNQNPKKRGKQL